MTLAAALFYVFSGVCIASAVLVVASRNPVHSVLFLILAFVNAAGLFLLAGAEFLALMLIVVYVGAVLVLFLFVVMMLDVDFAQLGQGFLEYLPVGALVAAIFLLELALAIGAWVVQPGLVQTTAVSAAPALTNIEQIGLVLYTRHVLAFQVSGLVLLVAMIGAIVLTLRRKTHVKRQDIPAQVARGRAIELEPVQPGRGL